jgi:hypothetical protein
MPLFGRSTPEDDARAAAWRDWFRKRHPFALASFVLGVFSLIEFGAIFLFGIAGLILGVLALVQLRRRLSSATDAQQFDEMSPGATHGHYLACAGIACSAASLLLAIFFTYRWI